MTAPFSAPTPRPRYRFADDRAFLPAALSIIETPPSPVKTGMITAIAAMVAIALGWSAIGRLDIVAVASGKVQPQGRVKTIQSVETGRIAAFNVLNGSHVKSGDILFSLDPAPAKAEAAEARTSWIAARAEAERHAAAVASAHLSTAQMPAWTDGIPQDVRAREELVLQSSIAALQANVAHLQAAIAEKHAERDRLDRTITAQSTLIGTLQIRVDMRTTLMNMGSGAKASVIDAQEVLQTQAATLASELGQRGEITAAIVMAQVEIEKAYTDFVSDNDVKRAEAERRADEAAKRLRRAKVTLSNLVVTSPIAGTVQGLSITTLGQVVTLGQEVMRIVPFDTPLEVAAYLPNRDIGFVREGQDVVVKIDAFPFTRYGSLKGRVTQVGEDAIPAPDAVTTEASPARPMPNHMVAGGEATQNLVFPITIALDSRQIMIDGRAIQLTPGMSVSAEIKTGSRTMLEYVVSPVWEVAIESMNER